MSMYLRQQWTDSRLQYNASEMLKQIELDNAIKTEIWVPDLSFMTDMDTKFHEVTVPNKMMFLYPSGLVSYSTRLVWLKVIFLTVISTLTLVLVLHTTTDPFWGHADNFCVQE